MSKPLIIFVFLCFAWFYLIAVDQPLQQLDTAISDSLRQSIEEQIMADFGINYNSTLLQASEYMELDLTRLKQELDLDIKNEKLDLMRLRQLGVSVYQVLLAKETIQFGFNEVSTLNDISVKFNIPIKKLKSLLKLNPNDTTLNLRSIQSLGLTLEQVQTSLSDFKDSLHIIGSNIIMVGMLVVFFSLLITSVIIMQLRHLNLSHRDSKSLRKIKLTSEGKLIFSVPETTQNDIVAVITALHIYKMQLEERRRINLTFQRNKSNYWRASGLYTMPNSNFIRK